MLSTKLFGPSVNIFDPLFGATTDDSQTAPQMALVILGTEPGSVDGFEDAGFVLEDQLLRALGATDLAMLPQEVQHGLLGEPAFTDAAVTIVQAIDNGDGTVRVALSCQVTAAEGDSIGFTLAGD